MEMISNRFDCKNQETEATIPQYESTAEAVSVPPKKTLLS
jgi:hypothetical protein